MNKSIHSRILTIIAAYIMAAYVEAFVFRIYLYVCGIADLNWLFSTQGIKAFVLSPISFPYKLLPFFLVKSLEDFAVVAKLLCAPLATFAGAFIIFYLIFNNMHRPSSDSANSP